MVGSRKDKLHRLNGPYRVSTNQINPTSILGQVPVESCVAVDDDDADGAIKSAWTRASHEACTDFTIAVSHAAPRFGWRGVALAKAEVARPLKRDKPTACS